MRGRPVFIVGMGIVSPLGHGLAQTVAALENHATGISALTLFTPPADRRLPVGQVRRVPGPEDLPRTHRLARMAADEAMAGDSAAPDAVVIGTTTGGMQKTETLLRQNAARPGLLTHHGAGTVAEDLAARFGCTGPVVTVSTACSSGGAAIKLALEMIRGGRARRVLAGGADSLCRLTYYGFNALQLLDPSGARPLDESRRGMTLSEGAAMLLLSAEPGPAAAAAVCGGGLSCDAWHPAAPHPEGRGALAAMRAALQDAGVTPRQVGYVNLHGTGTPDNDLAEARALRALFGNRLPPLSSIKGATGHGLAAAGAIEAVVSALCIRYGLVPGNPGLRRPDPHLKLAPLIHPRRRALDCVLSNSFGFGGNNAALVIGGPDTAPAESAPSRRRLYAVGSACLTAAGDAAQTLRAMAAGRDWTGQAGLDAALEAVPAHSRRRLGRFSALALALALAAREDAGHDGPPAGIFLGTAWGALSETGRFLDELFESDEKFASPTAFVGSVHNAAAGQTALFMDARGPNVTTSGGDSSFEQALLAAACLAPGKIGHFLVAGVDEHHDLLSPLFDSSVALGKNAADGGGALYLAAAARPGAPAVVPAFFGSGNPSVISALIRSLGGAERVRNRCGVLMVGIPAAWRNTGRRQLQEFLDGTGWRAPVIDYRRWTGEFGGASAVAAALAVRFCRQGTVPATLCGGTAAELGGRAILLLGLGTTVTALEIGGP